MGIFFRWGLQLYGIVLKSDVLFISTAGLNILPTKLSYELTQTD